MKKSNSIIEIKNLEKNFSDFKAIQNISLNLEKGKVIGLIGHNGCGKSTLFNLICGILIPTKGKITITGLDLETESIKIRESVSYLSDGTRYYGNLSARKNLEFFAELADKSYDKIDDYLKLVGLFEKKDVEVGGYSKGMMQRFAMAQCLLKEPKIILMDEPTAGVDPKGIVEFNKLIKNLNKSGMTIIVSSHHLSEIIESCEQIIVMKQGKIVLEDTTVNILKKKGKKSINEIFMKYYDIGEQK